MELEQIAKQIVHCAIKVSKALGPGSQLTGIKAVLYGQKGDLCWQRQ